MLAIPLFVIRWGRRFAPQPQANIGQAFSLIWLVAHPIRDNHSETIFELPLIEKFAVLVAKFFNRHFDCCAIFLL